MDQWRKLPRHEGQRAAVWPVQRLPHYRHVDTVGKPTTTVDFTVPVEGMEAPWGMAQIVFVHGSAVVRRPPKSMAALLAYAQAHPGRFTYPEPPDFLGSTFLKQALLELTEQREALQKPATDANFGPVSARGAGWTRFALTCGARGMTYPPSMPALRQLLADGEIDIAFSFHPNDASAEIAKGTLPDTVRSPGSPEAPSAIPTLSPFPTMPAPGEGALVVARFLLSPEAQARKQDPVVWGDLTVLAVDQLPPEDQQRFAAINPVSPRSAPHNWVRRCRSRTRGWMERLEAAWRARYSR